MTGDYFTYGWLSFLIICLLIGCYFWYTRTSDQTSKIFAIVVPVLVIPLWIYSVNVKDEELGGRRKRKLR